MKLTDVDLCCAASKLETIKTEEKAEGWTAGMAFNYAWVAMHKRWAKREAEGKGNIATNC